MAYQPKSYRKFVATAATATLVASAVTPAFAAGFTDVSDRYKEAVEYLVNEGIAQGLTETKFGVGEQIKRVDAAVMIAKALKLDTEKAPAAGFTDVPERAQGAVNALKAAGIINGKSDTKFGAADQLTRGEMALILVKAYKLTGSADHKFTDVSDRYADAVKALVANDITKGKSETQFGTADAIKRGEFAIFMHKINKPVQPPVVSDVKATGAKTIEITGTNLQNLKAENVTVSGNTVTAISPNGDGTKAVVALANNLVPNQETVVKTTINEETKEFKFTYEFVVNSVAVENATVDNDTPDQKVSLLVNSEKIDLDYLAATGYTVEFTSFDEDGKTAVTTLFDGATSTSTTGKLAKNLTEGKYKVQATVSKGSTVLSSELATITVTNLDSAASSISSYELTNVDLGAVQKSSTLVVGETANFSKVTVSAGNDKADVTGFKVESSDAGVVSITEPTAGNYVLNAEAPGTAKITLTYGKLTKEINVTVAAKAREAAKVTPETSSVKVVKGLDREVKVKVTDQYGDQYVADDVNVINPTDGLVTSAEPALITNEKGEATITLSTDKETGSATIYFRNADNSKLLGSLNASVTKVNTTNKRVLEVVEKADQSKDFTLDKNDTKDSTVTVELANYTSENVYLGKEALDGYTAKFNKDIVAVAGNATGEVSLTGTDFDVTVATGADAKAGTTDVAIFDAEGKAVGTVKVTVVDNAPTISKVSWVNPGKVTYAEEVINYKDVLNVIESANDDVVQGITLSSTVANKVRIDENGDTGSAIGNLYLDKNDDGQYNSGDVLLGAITLKKTASSTDTLAGTISDVVGGYTTAYEDKGTLVFTVENTKGDYVASTSVTVDVPKKTTSTTPAP